MSLSTPSSPPRHRPTVSMSIAIALGLVVLFGGIAALMSDTATRRAGVNAVRGNEELASSTGDGGRLCQGGELLPKDTATIRLSLFADAGNGPALALTAWRGGELLTQGRRAAGWSGRSIAIPVRRVAETADDVRICVALGHSGAVVLHGAAFERGSPNGATLDGGPAGGQLRVEYLRSGRESWWSYAPTVLHRLGLGRGWTGPWGPALVCALMLATVGCAVTALLRARTVQATRAIPTAAWLCALVGLFNAAAWSLITPAFQTADERDHVSYTQYLAETGNLPSTRPQGYSRELRLTANGVRYFEIATARNVGVWTGLEQRRLDRRLAAHPDRAGTGPGGASRLEPPLYYALEAIPYRLGTSGSLLDRLALMRLLSALMAAGTALLVFLFVREVLPGVPWAWTVGALGVAAGRLFGFTSGAVNADSLLFLTSAALFYCVARAFRRGVTVRSSVVIGLVIAAGVLAKLAFAGLVPAALAALAAIALRRAEAGSKLRALKLPAIAVAVAIVPIALAGLLNAVVWDRPAIGALAGASSYAERSAGEEGSLFGFLNFTWQLFLPPLPGMPQDFPRFFTLQELWLNGFVGMSPAGAPALVLASWVYRVALLPMSIVVVLLVAALASMRDTLRRRALELTAYALMALGVFVEISAIFYPTFLVHGRLGFITDSRYLLPLAALLATLLALAARGAGRRWGPAVGVFIVFVALGHDIGSQLHVMSKWYG
jgi:hypothetical protein